MRAVLAAWGQPQVIGPLGGGHRNPVLELRRGRERLVARRSRRSPASLDWEIGLAAGAAAACRQAWAGLAGTPQAVVHGDLAPANIRISSAGPGLLDWDEARVDYTDLDLADLPGSGLPPARLAVARRAVTAWEAANGWTTEPHYAERQLAVLGVGQPPEAAC